jgi:hypothetical protein
MKLHQFEGSHFDVGQALGRAFGNPIARVIKEYPNFQKEIIVTGIH